MILPTIRQGILSRMSRITSDLTAAFFVNTRFKRANLRHIRSTGRRAFADQVGITFRDKGHIACVDSNRVTLTNGPHKRRIIMKSRMTA